MAVNKAEILLTADSSKLRSEFAKATSAARSAGQQISSSLKGISTIAAGFGAAFSVAGIAQFVKGTISAASALEDLAQISGSSVEDLSRLKNIISVVGGDTGDLELLLIKLGKAISGIDEESSKAAKALAQLGITAKDPAQAITELALKLDQFADGPGKIAAAVDILGKEGAKLLPTLREIARTTDVFATVTAKQAQEAEQLEDAWRRLGVEATGLKNSILGDLVPALSKLIAEFREGINIAGGFFAAIANFGTINPFQSVNENLEETRRKIADIENNSGAGAKIARALGASDDVLDRLKKREQFLIRQKQLLADAQFGLSNADARDLRLEGSKPQLQFRGSAAKAVGSAAKGIDEFTSQLERARKVAASAQAEFDALLSGEKITSAGKALNQLLQDDSFNKLTQKQREVITQFYNTAIAIERETDALDESRKQWDEQQKAYQEAQENRARDVAQFGEQLNNYKLGNQALSDEISLLGKDDAARQKLIAAREFEALSQEALNKGTVEQTALLRKQFELRKQLIDEYAARVAELNNTEQIRGIFAGSFVDQLQQVVDGTKSLSDAFKDMERQIVASISRIAAQNIADAIFGKAGGSGGGFFGDLFKSVGSSLSSFANGTSSAPGGLAIVGERGPEIVNLPRGASVTPNHKIGGNVVSINVNVPAGTSSASADRIAVVTGRAVARAMKRNA